MIKKMSFIFALILIALSLSAQDFSKYQKQTLVDGKDTLRYRILFPEDFDATKKYPLLLFLHGRGESGSDNEKQLTHGGKLFLTDEFRKNHPAIVVFPQCAEDSYWSNVEIETINGKRFFNFQNGGPPTKAMSLVLKLTDQLFKAPTTDQKQIYVGGLSMGGMGTYELLRRKPKAFAAAFAICGGDHIANTKKYKNIPLWILHGGLDDVVNPQLSYNIYKTLKNAGHEPKFTIYPKANHNSWDATFAEPELLNWLFAHKK